MKKRKGIRFKYQLHCGYIYNEIKEESLLIEDQKTTYAEIQLLKFVDSISKTIYSAVADIRQVWRWDIENK